MKKLILTLVILTLLLGLMPAGAAQAKAPLQGETTHAWSGLPYGDGRVIFWEGEISGDIEGTIRWYGDPTEIWTKGQVSHYEMSWEIVEIVDGVEYLLLAGVDSGTTTARHGRNSVWRTNGIVTEANDEFGSWIGRHVHQSGEFGSVEGVLTGWSDFRVN